MATDERSFGVFKPVDHVVISFPSAEQADAAAQDLSQAGTSGEPAVRRLSDREMLSQIDRDMDKASSLAAVGQELNLIKAHRELAERGFHWLIVHAPDRNRATQVAQVARQHGAERAQLYGNFIIEELIDRDDAPAKPQVAESPDRGLDAETPSGEESERAQRRAGDKQARRA
jgi:hypothetical protein